MLFLQFGHPLTDFNSSFITIAESVHNVRKGIAMGTVVPFRAPAHSSLFAGRVTEGDARAGVSGYFGSKWVEHSHTEVHYDLSDIYTKKHWCLYDFQRCLEEYTKKCAYIGTHYYDLEEVPRKHKNPVWAKVVFETVQGRKLALLFPFLWSAKQITPYTFGGFHAGIIGVVTFEMAEILKKMTPFSCLEDD